VSDKTGSHCLVYRPGTINEGIYINMYMPYMCTCRTYVRAPCPSVACEPAEHRASLRRYSVDTFPSNPAANSAGMLLELSFSQRRPIAQLHGGAWRRRRPRNWAIMISPAPLLEVGPYRSAGPQKKKCLGGSCACKFPQFQESRRQAESEFEPLRAGKTLAGSRAQSLSSSMRL
jgi:hypothetical protein